MPAEALVIELLSLYVACTNINDLYAAITGSVISQDIGLDLIIIIIIKTLFNQQSICFT
jgi:hypothetical protein